MDVIKKYLYLFGPSELTGYFNQVGVLYFSTSIMKCKFRNLTITGQLTLKSLRKTIRCRLKSKNFLNIVE